MNEEIKLEIESKCDELIQMLSEHDLEIVPDCEFETVIRNKNTREVVGFLEESGIAWE